MSVIAHWWLVLDANNAARAYSTEGSARAHAIREGDYVVEVAPVNQPPGAVSLTDEQWTRVLWLLHMPSPPGPAKDQDVAIIRAINAQRGQ